MVARVLNNLLVPPVGLVGKSSQDAQGGGNPEVRAVGATGWGSATRRARGVLAGQVRSRVRARHVPPEPPRRARPRAAGELATGAPRRVFRHSPRTGSPADPQARARASPVGLPS